MSELGAFPSEDEAREAIVHVGRRMYDHEYVVTNDGNISVKIASDRIVVTPTGVSKGFMAVFELSDMFIIYRDADLMVVLPKPVIKAEDLPKIRSFFADNLGRGFRYQRSGVPLLVG